MSRNKIVSNLIRVTLEGAHHTKCCLNCKYSYFSDFSDTGLCHNKNQVGNNLHPKIVQDLTVCPYWEKKIDKKD